MTTQTPREQWIEQAARIIREHHRTIVRQPSRTNRSRKTFHNGEYEAAEALYPLLQQTIAVERDKALQEAAGIAETYSWQDGKMTENSCCAATGCDIAAAIRQMKGEG